MDVYKRSAPPCAAPASQTCHVCGWQGAPAFWQLCPACGGSSCLSSSSTPEPAAAIGPPSTVVPPPPSLAALAGGFRPGGPGRRSQAADDGERCAAGPWRAAAVPSALVQWRAKQQVTAISQAALPNATTLPSSDAVPAELPAAQTDEMR